MDGTLHYIICSHKLSGIINYMQAVEDMHNKQFLSLTLGHTDE